MTVGTLILEAVYTPADATASDAVAKTMGFVVFSLFNIVFGLSARSETGTVFTRDTVGDRRQLQLYGLALLLTLLGTELEVLQRILGTVSMTFDQWLLCIGLALALLLVDEAIKFFLRRRRPQTPPAMVEPVAGQLAAS